MKLKSFGCSFIHGTELADQKKIGVRDMPSKQTWPAHLANHRGLLYRCHAHGGSGNLQILSRVLDQIGNSTSSDLFVIGWTWIERFDYYRDNPDNSIQDPWLTITPTMDNSVKQTYYKHLHSEYRDKLVSLTSIKLAIDTLQQQKIPFIMTYLDPLLFDQRWHITPGLKDLQCYIQPYMTDFEGKNFLDWSQTHGYPIGPGGHPLEQAHRAASDYLINIWEKQQ